MKEEIEELEKQKAGDNKNLQMQIYKVIVFKKNEIKIIERNHVSNIQILNEMKTTLDTNVA